jgi:hypothetical protein
MSNRARAPFRIRSFGDVDYIDSVLLNLTERSCRRFQLLTGRTNVWLAIQLTNLSIVVYFVWAGFVYVLSGDAQMRALLAVFCGVLFYALTQTIFKVPIETYESNAYQRVAKGFRNPRRVRDARLRISFLTFALLLVAMTPSILLVPPALRAYMARQWNLVLLGTSLIVLTVVVLYLLACDPLPPCPGTVKQWIRGLVPSRLAAAENESAVGEG